MSSLLNRWLPVNSNRRMVIRALREVARAPQTIGSRFNRTNIANLLRYRSCMFTCPICGHATTPLYDFPDTDLRRLHKVAVLRETLQCRSCFSSLRQRSLALALLQYLNDRLRLELDSVSALRTVGLGGLAVLDTDNFSATSLLLRGLPGYTRCSYLPDQAFGAELEPGYFNIDLQRIDFPDASVDVVLTSDVMEHVRDDDAAHAEIFRVLKPRGAYIFTVPYDEHASRNMTLVDTSTDHDVFLCEPHIHGDILTGGIVAYRVFGRELDTTLESLGFEVRFHRLQRPDACVFDGDVFVASKPRRARAAALTESR